MPKNARYGPALRTLVKIGAMAGLFVTTAWSQVELSPLESINVEQGLSEGTVWSIAQDDAGFLWLGTSYGLNKYDGYSFEVFRAGDDETSLSGNEVRALLYQAPDTLWVGTSNGLNRFDLKRETNQRILNTEGHNDRLPGNYVINLAFAGEGRVWVGTRSGLGLYDPNTDHCETFRHEPDNPWSLLDDSLRDLALQGDTTVWIGSAKGLNRMDRATHKVRRFVHDEGDLTSLGKGEARAVAVVDGQLFVGVSTGLFRLMSDQESFERIPLEADDTLADSYWVNDIQQDPQGRLWVATRRNGVHRLDLQSGAHVSYREDRVINSLPSNNILSLFMGQSELMWMGSYKSGFAKLDLKPQKFRSFRPISKPDAFVSAVTAILVDQSHDLWLGTRHGLICQHADGSIEVIDQNSPKPRQLTGNLVLELFEDSQQRIWVGSYATGLSIIHSDRETIVNYQFDPNDPLSLPNDVVNSVVEDHSGRVYLGTRAGLHEFSPENGRSQRIGLLDSTATDSDRRIQTLLMAKSGIIWAGTISGLVAYQPSNGEAQRYQHRPADPTSLSHNVVVSLLEDHEGSVWVGTRMGLNRMRQGAGVFERFDESHGLADSSIMAIVEDARGELWVSTILGLSHILSDGSIINYDHSDGLQGNEFLPGSVATDSRGMIYLGGIQGYSLFHPEQLVINPYTPKVSVTTLRIFDRKVPLLQRVNSAGELVISHKENFFSLEFSALEHTASKKNRYEYQLSSGADTSAKWVAAGDRRTAIYSNLEGGQYIFRVRASNNDGVWGRQPAELVIRITPPFWRQRWFIPSVAALLLLCVLGLHQVRIRDDRAHHRVLASALSQRTESLKATRQQLIEEAQKAGVGETVTGLLHNLGNILTSVIVSAEQMNAIADGSKVSVLSRVADLMEEHSHDLASFVVRDPKGSKLPTFIDEATKLISSEQSLLSVESHGVEERIALLLKVIAMEGQYPSSFDSMERVDLKGLIQDSMQLYEYSLQKRGIQVAFLEEGPVPVCRVNPYKTIHILTNLIQNASDAIVAQNRADGLIRITLQRYDDQFNMVSVEDNGCGMSSDQLDSVFTYGFTTKFSGHGFGLYSCVVSMQEMGGEIRVASDGPGQGAVFTLLVPLQTEVSA